jgi:hypothetical protein
MEKTLLAIALSFFAGYASAESIPTERVLERNVCQYVMVPEGFRCVPNGYGGFTIVPDDLVTQLPPDIWPPKPGLTLTPADPWDPRPFMDSLNPELGVQLVQ